jgi:hypothetical protein
MSCPSIRRRMQVMVAKTPASRPWDAYRREGCCWQLLIPGWAGSLDDEELAYILHKLQEDDALSFWWGFRPGTKRRPIEAIKAVAMHGSPEVRGNNIRLARGHVPVLVA